MTGQIKYRKEFEPMVGGGVHFVRLNDMEGLRAAIHEQTCAFLLEPIQGEGGIRECSPEFLREARRLCDETETMLIFDEIQLLLAEKRTARRSMLFMRRSLEATGTAPQPFHEDCLRCHRPRRI